MNLRNSQLINLPVFTESGQKLGRVVDFELDSQRQIIVKYYVSGQNIIKELIGQDLLISSDQVISIDQEKMVVEDSAVEEKKRAKEKATAIPI